ncbi:MAG: WD40 repeat domain-containing protein [Victivallales bacterium]
MRKYLQIKLLVFFLVIIVGCSPSRNSIGIDIFDTKTGKHRFIPSGNFREVVVLVNEDKKEFYTLEREGNKFKYRTRNYEGTELKNSLIPMFSDGYCGNHSYTVTPDGQKFVYLKEGTKNLYLYDVKTGEESIIPENIIESMVNMCELKFISDKDFILALSNSVNNSVTAIYKMNIISKNKTLICSPVDLGGWGKFCFDRNKKYFSFWDAKEEYSIYGNYDIYDLANSKHLSTILGANKLFNGMGLSPSGGKFVFAEGGMIKIYDTATQKTSELKTSKPVSWVSGFMDEENILISNENIYSIYNIGTKKEHRLGNISANGNIFIIPGEGLIMFETGF